MLTVCITSLFFSASCARSISISYSIKAEWSMWVSSLFNSEWRFSDSSSKLPKLSSMASIYIIHFVSRLYVWCINNVIILLVYYIDTYCAADSTFMRWWRRFWLTIVHQILMATHCKLNYLIFTFYLIWYKFR